MAIEQLEKTLLYDSNMFLVIGAERTALIDAGTGFDPDGLVASIGDRLKGRPLDYLLITHRHFDHVGGMKAVVDAFSPKVVAGEADAVPLREGDSASTLGTDFGGRIYPTEVTGARDGCEMDLGGHVLRVIETPGHTSGSVSFYDTVTKTLFSGDTVFVDGIGRTDLPTASHRQLVESIKKLMELDVVGLCPGHGPSLKEGGSAELRKALRFAAGV
ncbi:MAG: MBL fold metallo-hydrolase [Thermoplasmatales archaeon]|nr:MBL fold metallo-hydrolase [Thermoplasmatales archaeon]